MLQEDDRLPELFLRGRATYSANLNATNPIGTVQSIEHTLRNLDRLATEQQNRVTRTEKELADYQSQADRPFEHEERLKQLLIRQSELNCLLDLDKGDQQGADSRPDLKDETDIGLSVAAQPRDRADVATMAEVQMRASGGAIREMPISERTPPQAGPISGKVVAKNEVHLAVATAANSFVVLDAKPLGRDVQIGERLSLRFHQGRASIDEGRNRSR
jgi:hypothetical protein